MKKKHKKKLVSTLLMMLVLTIVLPISTAQPTTMNENKRTTPQAVVDSNIHLTRDKVPLLQMALRQIENHQIRQLIQELISTLSMKKSLTSDDVHRIVNTYDLSVDVYTGVIQSDGGLDIKCVPGFLASHIMYIGPVCVGTWGGGNTRLGASHWCNNSWQQGCVIGFVGIVQNRLWEFEFSFGWSHHIYGVSCLTIIKTEY